MGKKTELEDRLLKAAIEYVHASREFDATPSDDPSRDVKRDFLHKRERELDVLMDRYYDWVSFSEAAA